MQANAFCILLLVFQLLSSAQPSISVVTLGQSPNYFAECFAKQAYVSPLGVQSCPSFRKIFPQPYSPFECASGFLCSFAKPLCYSGGGNHSLGVQRSATRNTTIKQLASRNDTGKARTDPTIGVICLNFPSNVDTVSLAYPSVTNLRAQCFS